MLTAYVDGSYSDLKKMYSFGLVLIKDGEIIFEENGTGNDPSNVGMRNVAGEIMGSMKAMSATMDRGERELNLYYDYDGIEKWCTGAWKANKIGTRKYQAYYDLLVSNGLVVNFHKVTAHTGVQFNERADQLAKIALGIINEEKR